MKLQRMAPVAITAQSLASATGVGMGTLSQALREGRHALVPNGTLNDPQREPQRDRPNDSPHDAQRNAHINAHNNAQNHARNIAQAAFSHTPLPTWVARCPA